MRRLLNWLGLGIVGIAQILQCGLGIITQTFEAKSGFGIAALTLAGAAPFLCSLYIVDSVARKKYRSWVARAFACYVTIFTFAAIFFSIYRIGRKFSFDIFWFWYNFTDSFRTLMALDRRFPYYAVGGLLLILLHYFGLTHIYSRLKSATITGKPTRFRIPNRLKFWGGLLLLATSQAYIDNEPRNVLIQALTPIPQAATKYIEFHEDSLAQNKRNLISDLSVKHRNLFLVHLESLNANFVNPRITPNLLRYATENGVLFPVMQAPSVLTIRSQETILCSVLPALKENIASRQDRIKGLKCLPKVFQEKGYKTLYFHSYPSFKFANREVFMKAIGFDELHASDIMRPSDKLLSWGYPEDIFYTRVFEYLERYRGQKIFAYIAVNTTNHFPFYDREKKEAFSRFNGVLPYPRSEGTREDMANTTFLQDQFFGEMYRTFMQRGYSTNSNMIIFGDHSWPIGLHDNNTYGENGAFQENFATSLAILPAEGDRPMFRIGERVTRLYSYLDFLPTMLDLYGITDLRYYGQSFLAEALKSGRPIADRCVIAIQPFGGGYIAMVNYPKKDIYKLGENTVIRYDLREDPDENSPTSKKPIDAESTRALERCLQSLRPRERLTH